MSERLNLANKLLASAGFIFISIDDNELYQLKLLCDSIFGENKYFSTITVETSMGIFGPKAKHIKKSIIKNKDYILCYAKDIDNVQLEPLYTKSKTLFDTHFTWYKNEKLECHLNDFLVTLDLLNEKATLLNLSNNISNLDKIMNIFPEVNKLMLSHADSIFRIRDYTLSVPDEYLCRIEKGEKIKIGENIVFKNEQNKLMYLYPWEKLINITSDYSPEIISSVVVGDLWKGFNDDMGNIGKEGEVKFSNGKKPIRLTKNLLKLTNIKKALILDFFAGSGTTGHAVMQLNKEDGGNRKYILCTNNENNICEEVTYQRLKNIQEDLPHNLKYYRTDFIPKFSDSEDSISEKMMEHIRELIELEYAIELDGKKYILLDDEDRLDEAISMIENDGKLFARSGIFLSRSNQRILEEKGVNIIEIPEYYFRDELKEVGEL